MQLPLRQFFILQVEFHLFYLAHQVGIEPTYYGFGDQAISNYLYRYIMVVPVGIEPTSQGLQPSAKTTSATEP